MPFRSYRSRSNRRPPSGGRRIFGLVKVVVFLAVVGGAGWIGFHQIVDNQIRDRVQKKIDEGLFGTGLRATLGQAQFIPGHGILLNHLSIEHVGLSEVQLPPSTRSRIEISEIVLHAPVTAAELAMQDVKIRAVELRRAKLTLVRDHLGHWDIQDVFEALTALRGSDPKPIPVQLTDCEVRVVDLGSTLARPITLSNVSIVIQPIVHEGRELLQINGGFESAAVSKIEFTTFLDRQAQTWDAKLTATRARLSRDFVSLLPVESQNEFQSLRAFSADVSFTASANGAMSLSEVPTVSIRGRVERLAVDDSRLPTEIRDVRADFHINNMGVELTQVVGKMGPSDFQIRYSQRGFLERENWDCVGNIQGFELNQSERQSRWLPQHCQKFCHEYMPLGTSNIRFDLSFDQTWQKREIVGELTNMSFKYVNLPYLVENCTGVVRLSGDVCTFDVRSMMNQQLIRFQGFAKNFGRPPVYELNISVPGELPFDQKMLTAIDARPEFAKVIRAFNATGRVGGVGKIEKRTPNGAVIKSFDVRLQQCSVRHTGFDFPINNISGLIQTRDETFTFSNLTGNNGNGKVVCNGTWDPVNGLGVRFLCNSIPLNDQLRYALRPEIREIWDGFRPRGTMDFMRVDLRLPAGSQDVDVVVEASMRESKDAARANLISIHPTWFPYEINHITGTVKIGNGQIGLRDVKGRHQRTWIVCQGGGLYSDDSWSVRLEDLLVGGLKVDEDLLAAVPSDLAQPIRGLKFDGILNVNGEITLAGTLAGRPVGQWVGYDANIGSTQNQGATRIAASSTRTGGFRPVATQPVQQPTTSMAWDLRIDLNRAKMLIGVPLENVYGKIQWVGQFDGESAECRGELDIDSVTLYGAQITKIRGPIWLDNIRAAAGIFARPQPGQPTLNISPIDGNNKARSVTGLLHGGVVYLDAQMNNTGRSADFYVQATLADSSLETACREFAPHLKNTEGHCFAAVRMSGDYSGTHANRGEGTIQLRDAKIYELPIFLSLLKIPNFRQFTRTAFDSSNIDFTIEGERINFSRMEFIGDAISLIGNGVMTFDRDIDLNFYSVIGRNRFYLPLISELYQASSQKILWIEVDGKLDNPQVHRHVLGKLNEAFQQLMQPGENSNVRNRFRQDHQPIPTETGELRFQSPDSGGYGQRRR